MTQNDDGQCSWHSSTAGSKLNAIQYEKSCPSECRDPDSFVTCFSPAEVLWPVVYVSTFFNRSYMKLVVANGTNPRSNMCHWSNNNSCESRIIGGHYITIWISFFWSHVYPTIHFWASLNPVQESSSCSMRTEERRVSQKTTLLTWSSSQCSAEAHEFSQRYLNCGWNVIWTGPWVHTELILWKNKFVILSVLHW